MNLRRLKHAVILSEEGSFVRASERLHITPTALTKSIQSLESQLNIKLFERSKHGATPTPAAKDFISEARELLSHAEHLEKKAELIRTGLSGSVRFGVGPFVVEVLIDVLAAVCREMPGLDVQVSIESPDQLARMLTDETIEFAIGDLSRIDTELSFVKQPLVRLPSGYFVRKDHPLLDLLEQRPLQLDDLIDYPLLHPAYSELRPMRMLSERGVIGGGYFSNRISCDNTWASKAVAMRSNAILLASDLSVKTEIKQGLMQRLGLKDQMARTYSDVSCVRLVDHVLSPGAERIMKLAAAEIGRQFL